MQETTGKKSRRRHDNEGTWVRRLEAFRESGMAVRAFCRQEGIGISTYYRWHLKLKGRVRKAGNRAVACGFVRPPFIPVQVKAESRPSTRLSAGDWACEVTGRGRVRLRLRERPSWEELLQLMAAMAGDA